MSRYLSRLKFIHNILRVEACDINSLCSLLEKNCFEAHRRSIYRDLEKIKKTLISNNEQFIETLINNKKKIWKIVQIPEFDNFNYEDLLTLNFVRNTIPVFIDTLQKNRITQALDLMQFNNLKQSQISIQSNNKVSISCSDFYQKIYNQKEFNSYKDIHWCISNLLKISIKNNSIDASCVSLPNREFIFTPIKLLYHRGSLFVAGLLENKRTIVLDISQIEEYSITKKKYRKHNELKIQIENELSKRFGISDNMDDGVYDIEIEFSKETGEYLKHFIWHPTQKFKITNTGYILTMKCGINRELVGWVFQFMNNVRILQPEKLRILYLQQVKRMMDLNTNNMTLKYSNIFLKKG